MASSFVTPNKFKDYLEKHVFDISDLFDYCIDNNQSYHLIPGNHIYFDIDGIIDEIIHSNESNLELKAWLFHSFGFNGLMTGFLPLVMSILRVAETANGFPYGGFIRSLVEYFFGNDDQFGDHTRFCGDVDLWFRQQKDVQRFITELKKLELVEGWKIFDYAREAEEGNKESYGFEVTSLNIGVPFRYHGITGILTAFRLDLTVSKECIPISDMSVNCLIYRRGKFESHHPYYTSAQLIGHILGKQIRMIQPGTFGHDLFLYADLLDDTGTDLKDIDTIKKEFPEQGSYYNNIAEEKWQRLHAKFFDYGWKIVLETPVESLQRRCALVIDQSRSDISKIPPIIKETSGLVYSPEV